MAISLNSPILNGAAELGDKVGREGILLDLDVAATAEKLGLNATEAETLSDWLDSGQPPPLAVQGLLQRVREEKGIASIKDLERYFIYVPVGAELSGLSRDRSHGRTYVSLEYPNAALGEIISRHPQAKWLCGGRDSMDISLGEQLRVTHGYFAGAVECARQIGEPAIKDRIANWFYYEHRPWQGDLERVIAVWQQYTNYIFSLNYPLSELGDIIAQHPQTHGICGGRKPRDIPLVEQIKILSKYCGGEKFLENTLNVTCPGIGKKVSEYTSAKKIRPRLDDLAVAAGEWKKIMENGDARLDVGYPLPALAKVAACHPQAAVLWKKGEFEQMALGAQLKSMRPYFAGRGVTGTMTLKTLMPMVERWPDVAKADKMILSLQHPLPVLGKIIARIPQAEILCEGISPDEVILRRQLKILSNYIGGQRVIEKALGKKYSGIGLSLNDWISHGVRPRWHILKPMIGVWSQLPMTSPQQRMGRQRTPEPVG